MRSIRFIIFLRLFLVSSASFALLAGTVYLLSDRMITRFYVEDNTNAVRFISENIRSNYLAHLKALDETGARLSPFSRAQAESEATQFLRFNAIYKTLHAYRADGELLVARKRDEPGYRASRSFREKPDREFIELADQVLRDGKARMGAPFMSPSGTFYQTYLVPIPGAGPGAPAFGILSGGIDLGRTDISYLISGSKFGDRNFIAVSDRRGNLLAQDGLGDEPRRALVAGLARSSADAPAPGPRLVELGGGERYYVFASPLEGLRAQVLFGVSLDRMNQKRARILDAFLIVLPIGLLLSFFMSLLVGDRLAKPLRRAITGISRIREGDYSYRIGYDRDDEIGLLCESVDDLSRKIRKARFLGYLWSLEPRPPGKP